MLVVSKYAEIMDAETLALALSCARGSYQRNLIRGYAALSGATLRGKAKRYSGRYRASARNLIRRMKMMGLLVTEERRQHGRRVLIIAKERR